MIHYSIIADDLSGSCDTAVVFSNNGYKTLVLNMPEGLDYDLEDFNILSISTNSRDISPEEAKKSVTEACRYLKSKNIFNIYKKIDSTWRGNIGVELETLMEEYELSMIIICSAFPKTERLVRDGYLLIDGTPLGQTSMAADPGCPIHESFLPKILGKQTSLPVELIDYKSLSKGAGYLMERLKNISEHGKTLILVDALREEDLDLIASIDKSQLPPFIFCGSAGLFNALLRVNSFPPFFPQIPPVVVVVGSVNPRNLVMTDYLIRRGLVGEVYIDPVDLLLSHDVNFYRAKIKEFLSEGRDLIIRTYRGQEDRARVNAVMRDIGLNEYERACCIAEGLKKAVGWTLQEFDVSGLLITGGATALSILRGINSVGIQVEEELEPGIPMGSIIGGDFFGLSIVTKAGGFGCETTFIRAIQALKRKYMLKGGKV